MTARHGPTPEFTRRVLGNTHNLVTWHYGQNYVFNGCMQYLMECVGASGEYDYWLFSGVTGDSFTQLYRTNSVEPVTSLSHDTFDRTLVRTAFAACGYDVEFVGEAAVQSHPEEWRQRIVASLDDGIPVITKGWEGTRTFAAICGYENAGERWLALKEDATTPALSRSGLEHSRALLFLGAKRPAPPLAEVYRTTVLAIPSFMTRPAQDGLVFGRAAFEAWADGMLCHDAIFADKDEAEMERLRWRLHCSLLCIAGTNGCAREFLAKARTLCPDLEMIPRLQPIYEKMQSLFKEIRTMQGGFWIPFETLRDAGARRAIASKIREFGPCCDQVLAITQA
jgi:hypothetical protein